MVASAAKGFGESGYVRHVVIIATLLAPLLGCVAAPHASPPREAVVIPPPAVAESPPSSPTRGMVWVAGYWHWTGLEHAWISGRWEHPPRGER